MAVKHFFYHRLSNIFDVIQSDVLFHLYDNMLKNVLFMHGKPSFPFPSQILESGKPDDNNAIQFFVLYLNHISTKLEPCKSTLVAPPQYPEILPIFRSFVVTPQVHVRALDNGEFLIVKRDNFC